MKRNILILLSFSLLTFPVLADPTQATDLGGGSVATATEGQTNTPSESDVATDTKVSTLAADPARDDWQFLSCVDSYIACEHEARDHGYHHYRVRSSGRCDHDHYACYGRN